MKWEKMKLEEIGSITSGGTPSTGNPAYWNGEIPWITPKDLSGFEYRYIEQGERNITEEGLKNSSAKLIREKSVLLTSRAPIGYLAIAKNEVTTNQGFKNITPSEKCDFLYLFYCLKNNVEYLKSLGIGATYPELSSSRLKEIEIPIPPLPTQRKIAGILSAYDDLIENNLKRIKLLEEKAFLRYKLLDKTTKHKLSDLYDTSSGGTPSRTNSEYFTGEINWFKSKELTDSIILESEEKITEQAFDKSSAKLFPQGSVILAMYGATIGKLGLLSIPSSTNQACCAIIEKNKEQSSYFIFNWLLENREYVLSFRMGAAQENISQHIIKNLVVWVPSNSDLKLFNSEMKPIYTLIKNIHQQNKLLREARDILLPKLMTGQIEV